MTFTPEESAMLRTALRMLETWHRRCAGHWRTAAGEQSATATYHEERADGAAALADRIAREVAP